MAFFTFAETLRLQHAAVRTCAVSRVLSLSPSPARAAIGCSDHRVEVLPEESPEVGTQSCRI
ncbi:MAG: hypothetical protein KBD64_05830 [Gammaproteobacteria bacterium]|nr:hypothetical protein [Gammaproteobacteria bacterium]